MDVDLKAAVDASEASGKTVYEELKRVSSGRWTKYSGMVKLFCSDTSFWVSDSAIQLCGGIGYTYGLTSTQPLTQTNVVGFDYTNPSTSTPPAPGASSTSWLVPFNSFFSPADCREVNSCSA